MTSGSTPSYRLILAESHPHLRAEIHAVLERAPEFRLVGEFQSGLHALSEARRLAPDLALLDAHLPDCDPLLLARLFHAFVPRSRVVLLVDDPQQEATGLRNGAHAVVAKRTAVTMLVPALRRVCSLESNARGENA